MELIRLLLIDDDESIRRLVSRALPERGFNVELASTAEEGLEKAKNEDFDVVLLDNRLPGAQGLEVLESLRQGLRAPEVVMITGHPGVESAIQAMKLGAFDYVSKPFQVAKLSQLLQNASAKRRLQRENTVLRHIIDKQIFPTGPVVSDSEAMKQVLALVDRVAASDASVLIQGETGTGKGLTAKLIHGKSRRARAVMMHLNCSAFAEQLLESELFGHEKGAFTGAVSEKPGLFEVADSGTLFLDEVAEMSPAMQAKLLQVLDSGEIRRVGGTSLHKVDVRVLAATNKDLKKLEKEGRFRADLRFRLEVVNLTLPPLRERQEDIAGLAALYLRRYRLPGDQVKSLSPAARERLEEYPWPGNVRELANVIEGAVLLASGAEILPEDLPAHIIRSSPAEAAGPAEKPAPRSLAEMERRYIVEALDYTGGKKAPAARLLGIDVKTLYNKIKAYDIEV